MPCNDTIAVHGYHASWIIFLSMRAMMDTPEGWCQPKAKDVSSYLCDFFSTNNKHRLPSWYRSHCFVSTGDVDLPNIATKLACYANFKDQDKKRVFMLVIYRVFALRCRHHVGGGKQKLSQYFNFF